MSWEINAQPYLEQKQYLDLVNYYEQLIADNPEEIHYYWYLGLAYLLAQQVEESQSTWLCVFSQGDEDDIQKWTTELVNILHSEAEQQQADNQLDLAWLIRTAIQDIQPENLSNLLQLSLLEIELKKYQFSRLQDWNLLDILQTTPANLIPGQLLWQVLPKLLWFPCAENVALISLAWDYAPDLASSRQQVVQIAIDIAEATEFATDSKYLQILYGIELLKLCLDKEPDNLNILKAIYILYRRIRKFSEALESLEALKKYANNNLMKLCFQSQIISLLLKNCDWQQLEIIIDEYIILLEQVINEKPQTIEPIVRDLFLYTVNPLLYLQDEPQLNRWRQNQISKIWQNIISPNNNYLSQNHHNKQTNQRLKIGYISSSLRKHSVGWLSRWLIHYHNREQFQIFIYLVNQEQDELTKVWFQDKADIFRNSSQDIYGITQQIIEDEIDILVDLDSLSSSFISEIISLKPAPIQVTWLGFDASGIPTIDYFLTDKYVLPPNSQSYYQEQLWSLPVTYVAVDGFEVGVPSYRRENLDLPTDAVVYLNIQGVQKLNPEQITLQLKIIQAVPNSYLLFKGTAKQEFTENYLTELAKSLGIEANRLRFLPKDRDEETHRANLAIADIALDTYPYNGATTTLEILWMGIPLVTRVGKQFASRNSYAFMMQVGLTEGVAWSDEEYVEWGIKLGKDPQLRQQIQTKLRQSRQTSPLWNAEKFTLDLEQAYQQMWAKYSRS